MISAEGRLSRLIRTTTSLLLAAVLGAAMPLAALGQDTREGIVDRASQEKTEPGGQSTQDQSAQKPNTQPLALSPEVSGRRVGVDENNKRLLTLQDVISLALQNNLSIEQSRQNVQIAQYNLFSLRGFYDVTTGGSIGYQDSTRPTANVFSGGGTSLSFNDKSLFYNFTTSQQIQRTGANYLIEFDNSRLATSATNSLLDPQYNTSLQFTFIQPLVRNLSIDANRREIRIAKKSLDLSDSQFRQQVIAIINSVQHAYWELLYAIEAEKIARDNLQLSKQLLEDNKKQVEAGKIHALQLRSNEAQIELNKGQVIAALRNITSTENVLKRLLLKDPNDQMWNAVLFPTDKPDLGQETFNLQESTALALKNRPELDQLRLQSEQKDIDIKFYKNRMKPQVDLVGIYANTGLAGEPVPRIGFDGQPIPSPVANKFVGGYGKSLRNLISQDFRTWQVGVSFSFPWRNRTAEANLGRTLAESKQLDARQRQLVQEVQTQVRDALQAVEAARMSFEAARAARLAVEEALKGEEELLRLGLTRIFFVLEYQSSLAVTRNNEMRTLIDCNRAIADLQRVTGLTLVNNNIQVQALPENKSR